MSYIRSLAQGVMLGSMSVVVASALTGCSNSHQEQQQAQNKFLVIEQLTNGKYVVVEEIPTSGPTRAIIREKGPDGQIHERVMTEEEMRRLAEQEYQKVQNGTSETVQPGGSEGMGLAGTILAVAAGSLLGNMVANSLMNNANFRQRASTVNRSAYSRSANRSTTSKRSSTRRSFFGGSGRSSSYGSRSYYGG
ncbi:Putative flagellar motility protein [hydrothermal vent metagenome]|uniref:Putative flagellar motility protein n=1 Tax=hydrothermal vent metagenome TaxID=652676 RepID=A0A1W1BLS4_9ZZZZ